MAEDYPVNIVFDAVDQITKPLRRINDRIERMGGPIRQFNNRMQALGREGGLNRLYEASGNVLTRLGGVRDAAGQVATRVSLIGGAAAFGLNRMFTSFGRAAEQVEVLSGELGAGIGWLQEWQYVAEQTGIPQDRLNESMREFNGRLGELRAGSGPLVQNLKEINPALVRQLQNTNSLEEAWSVYMDAMQQASDEQERAALASAAFSDEGRVLANIALLGSERVAQLRQEGRRYGQVMGQEAVDSGQRFLNVQRNMFAAFSGLAIVLSTELLPVVNDLFTDLTAWIVDNQSLVREWASSFAANLPGHLQAIQEGAQSLFDAVQPLSDAIGWMFDTFGTGNTILAAAAVTIGGPLITAVAALVPAVIGLGVAIGATPIGWFAAGAAGIGAAIWGVSEAVDYVRENWPGAWRTVSNVVGGVIDTFRGFFELITGRFESFKQTIDRMATAAADLVPDWLKNWFSDDGDKEVVVRHEGAGGQGAAGARGAASGGRSVVQMQQGSYRRQSWMTVDMKNVPRGTRVERGGDEDDGVDLNVGYQMGP